MHAANEGGMGSACWAAAFVLRRFRVWTPTAQEKPISRRADGVRSTDDGATRLETGDDDLARRPPL
jgi:hypothetical protein